MPFLASAPVEYYFHLLSRLRHTCSIMMTSRDFFFHNSIFRWPENEPVSKWKELLKSVWRDSPKKWILEQRTKHLMHLFHDFNFRNFVIYFILQISFLEIFDVVRIRGENDSRRPLRQRNHFLALELWKKHLNRIVNTWYKLIFLTTPKGCFLIIEW